MAITTSLLLLSRLEHLDFSMTFHRPEFLFPAMERLSLLRWCRSSHCADIAQFALLLLALIFGLPTLILLIVQATNISRNITVNETFNKDKYFYLKDEHGVFKNPFDRGFTGNWTELCCGDREAMRESYRRSVEAPPGYEEISASR